MRTILMAVLSLSLLPMASSAGERSAYPGLPTVQDALEGSVSREILKAAAAVPARPSREASLPASIDFVRMDLYTFSDGTFNIWEPFVPLNIRAHKIFWQDFDFDFSGDAARERFDGSARSNSFNDPTWGYSINGNGFSGQLTRLGSDWTLNGTYDLKDEKGNVRKEHFYLRFDRFSSTDSEYRVWENGLDLKVRINPISTTVEGTYDKEIVKPKLLAVLGVTAGILSQPKLLPYPPRP